MDVMIWESKKKGRTGQVRIGWLHPSPDIGAGQP